MSPKLPHHHMCKECGIITTEGCQCFDKRMRVALCIKCYIALKTSERKLENGRRKS